MRIILSDFMAQAWPERAGDPFADTMNAIEKYVVSGTLTAEEATSGWTNTTLIGGADPIAGVRELRARAGDGAIQVMGSSTLARTLVAEGLVDEYRLMLEPILLGGGKSIFPTDGEARSLELVAATPAATGVLICTYRPLSPATGDAG